MEGERWGVDGRKERKGWKGMGEEGGREGKGREGRLCSIAQTLLLECRVNLMLISIIYIPALHSQLASCVGCMVFHSSNLSLILLPHH